MASTLSRILTLSTRNSGVHCLSKINFSCNLKVFLSFSTRSRIFRCSSTSFADFGLTRGLAVDGVDVDVEVELGVVVDGSCWEVDVGLG